VKRLLAKVARVVGGGQRGAVNLGGFVFMAVGLIFLGVGFVIYPMVISGTDNVMSWTATIGGHAFSTANFTGLVSIVPIIPLIVALGFIVSTCLSGYMGIQTFRGSGTFDSSPSEFLLQGVGMIFIAVALIVFPIAMTGVGTAWASILDSANVSSYSAVTSFLPIIPLLALVGTVFIGVCVEYFGLKKSLTGSYS
jgi:hypothetical protein